MALDLAAGRGTERLRLERLRPECAGCGLTGPGRPGIAARGAGP